MLQHTSFRSKLSVTFNFLTQFILVQAAVSKINPCFHFSHNTWHLSHFSHFLTKPLHRLSEKASFPLQPFFKRIQIHTQNLPPYFPMRKILMFSVPVLQTFYLHYDHYLCSEGLASIPAPTWRFCWESPSLSPCTEGIKPIQMPSPGAGGKAKRLELQWHWLECNALSSTKCTALLKFQVLIFGSRWNGILLFLVLTEIFFCLDWIFSTFYTASTLKKDFVIFWRKNKPHSSGEKSQSVLYHFALVGIGLHSSEDFILRLQPLLILDSQASTCIAKPREMVPSCSGRQPHSAAPPSHILRPQL